jgi:hypothetical protein
MILNRYISIGLLGKMVFGSILPHPAGLSVSATHDFGSTEEVLQW